MSATEFVSVTVSGTRYSSWEFVRIGAGVKHAAREFELRVAAEAGASATASAFQAFTPVSVYAGGDLLLKGYVDVYHPRIGKDNADITISGRSKAADAVDCSVEHRKPDYVSRTLLQIAQDQDRFGIGFSVGEGVQLAPIPLWRPNPGETLFHALDRLCHDAQCTMAGQPDGSIKFVKAGVSPPRQAGALVEGVNIKIGDSVHDCSGRHSKTMVHGQGVKGSGAQSTQIMATAEDSTVPRTRELHVVNDADTDRDRTKKHARHHRDHQAGNGLRATITTAGWRDETGALWTPGNKVYVESPFLAVEQDMLIEHVAYTQDNGREGTQAILQLVDPRAHGGTKGAANKSGSTWNMDSSPAN